MGQGGVDRAVRFEVTPDEVNFFYRQESHLPYPRNLLFEDLAEFTQSSLGDPVLDAADRKMRGIRPRLGLIADCLVQLLAEFPLESDQEVRLARETDPDDSCTTGVREATEFGEVQRERSMVGGYIA
jgi:hypothetical protein